MLHLFVFSNLILLFTHYNYYIVKHLNNTMHKTTKTDPNTIVAIYSHQYH